MRVFILIACLIATSAVADPVPRAYINNEDSHPHEVFPGRTAEFYVDVSKSGGRIDVKCLLSGTVGQVTLKTFGFEILEGRLPRKTFAITKPIEVDVVGQITPGIKDAWFRFTNGDAGHLLWRQCYNN
jgi:hypothetical protein